MLELSDLVKHYPAVGGEPVRAVDGVTLSVGAGEMVALNSKTLDPAVFRQRGRRKYAQVQIP